MLWTQAPDERAEEESVITVRPAAERGQTDWGWLELSADGRTCQEEARRARPRVRREPMLRA